MADSGLNRSGSTPNANTSANTERPFPKIEGEFSSDDRIAFDQVKNKWILTEGQVQYEWIDYLKTWFDTDEQAAYERHQSTYQFPQTNTKESSNTATSKRKREGDDSAAKPSKEKKATAPRPNSSVYATGIPLDATFEEIYDLFKSRGGLIMNNIDDEKPRIKMYADEEGFFKGDALITFYQATSVNLAVMLLDKTDFRKGGDGPMRVQEADMSYKKQKHEEKEVSADKVGLVKGKGKGKSSKDVEKIKRMTKEMEAKLADWGSDDEPQTMPDNIKPANKWNKCVIVKHMFTLENIEKNPKELMEIEEDIRDMAEEQAWGEITKIVAFDEEEDGIIMIRFRTVEEAENAVSLIHGRAFDGRRLTAEIASSRPRFKRRILDEDDEAARLEAYGRELEEEG